MASEGEEGEGHDDKEEEGEKAKPLAAPVSQPLLIGSCSGFIETTVKIKQNDMLPGPKVCAALSCMLGDGETWLLSQIDFHLFLFFFSYQLELDGKVGCVHMLLSPDQITHLTDLLAALCIDTGTVKQAV